MQSKTFDLPMQQKKQTVINDDTLIPEKYKYTLKKRINTMIHNEFC